MKISLFTPTHDSKWIPELYESLLVQTYQNWEWVITYNNGGVKIGFADPRVVEIEIEYATDGWVGPMKAFACSKCTGEVLLEMDHDDLLTPDCLEEVAKAYQDTEIGFVYSNSVFCDGKLEKIERFAGGYDWQYRMMEFQGKELDELIHTPPMPDNCSKIWFQPNHLRSFRRTVYDAVGGYNTKMRVLDDQDLMSKMFIATKFKHIDKGLYIYRVHGENTWIKHSQEITANVLRIYDQYIEGIADVWAEREGLLKLELGGRMNAKPGYTTVDLKEADIIHDLNTPWPWADSSVGCIRAMDVLEHLVDPLFTMKELYRVLAPAGWAFIRVPSTDGRGAFQDPTHCSFWNENSFHYYTKECKAKYIDTPVRFQSSRLYTTELDQEKVCWTIAHLVSMKDGYRPAGIVEI